MDEKYFVPKDGRAEFDKLSIDDMRNKKVYYESGYKLTKGETESDLTKYLGGKAAHENLIANVEDVIESYKLMFILTALIVLMAFILAYIIAKLNKADQAVDKFDPLVHDINAIQALGFANLLEDNERGELININDGYVLDY